MVNTYLFGIRGQHNTKMALIALEPAILDYRNAVLGQLADTNPIQAVIPAGAAAATCGRTGRAARTSQ